MTKVLTHIFLIIFQGALSSLDDSSVSLNLKERFEKKLIYVSFFRGSWLRSVKITQIFFSHADGDDPGVKKKFMNFSFRSQTYAQNILIAVNPYDTVPSLYGSQKIFKYLDSENLFENPPHIYAIGKYCK